MYPKKILTLISHLKKLPGIGAKTAERFAFELIKWSSFDIKSFAETLSTLKENLKKCKDCGCLKENDNNCYFCDNPKKDKRIVCVIASAKDAYSIEKTNSYNGVYYVIDNLLSPMQGYNIEEINIENLERLITKNNVKEVIIALDSTLEGDATSLFLKNKLKEINVTLSRLAFGLPIGSSLEYVDGGTLTKSFVGRQTF